MRYAVKISCSLDVWCICTDLNYKKVVISELNDPWSLIFRYCSVVLGYLFMIRGSSHCPFTDAFVTKKKMLHWCVKCTQNQIWVLNKCWSLGPWCNIMINILIFGGQFSVIVQDFTVLLECNFVDMVFCCSSKI